MVVFNDIYLHAIARWSPSLKKNSARHCICHEIELAANVDTNVSVWYPSERCTVHMNLDDGGVR